MLTVRVDEDIENRLNVLAKKTGHTKTYFIKKAIKEFLEDYEDYLLALKALEDKGPTISFEEVKKLVEQSDVED